MQKQNKSQIKERTISASRLRRLFAEIAEDITEGLDSTIVSYEGNTFHIHLEGATVNVSFSTTSAKK